MEEASIRYWYRGNPPSRGKVLRDEVDSGASTVSGSHIMELLSTEGIDCERFGACWYSEEHDGYLELKSGDNVPLSHHGRKCIDIQLEEQREWSAAAVSRLVSRRSEDKPATGYFGIGIVRGKTESNHGILWRTAYQLGASFIFTIGARYEKHSEGMVDTYGAVRTIPCFQYEDWTAFASSSPFGSPLVGIETGGTSLDRFEHPPCACYLLGAEDSGLPAAVIQAMHHTVSIPAARGESFNVAVAGSLVMYDRYTKELAAEAAAAEQCHVVNEPNGIHPND